MLLNLGLFGFIIKVLAASRVVTEFAKHLYRTESFFKPAEWWGRGLSCTLQNAFLSILRITLTGSSTFLLLFHGCLRKACRSSPDNLLSTPSCSIQALSYTLLLLFSLPCHLYHLCLLTNENISPYKEVSFSPKLGSPNFSRYSSNKCFLALHSFLIYPFLVFKCALNEQQHTQTGLQVIRIFSVCNSPITVIAESYWDVKMKEFSQ